MSAHAPDGAGTSLLRFSTAGSVDDGKSTLIGRLLYETKQIYEDQLASIERVSRQAGADYLNLALLTDGLRAEREQGITIDVAYRYFATPKRKFIIADTPGHVQYTRNMVTGTSTADAAVVLVDARNGVVEQSRRHASIASLLRVPHLVVCVNKMDLVGYSQEIFEDIRREFLEFATRLKATELTFIPMSALNGDNVVEGSSRMPWYEGLSLRDLLEQLPVASDLDEQPLRFPVQWVVPSGTGSRRAYAGQVASGSVRPGQKVRILPQDAEATVLSVETFDGPLEQAYPPLSVALRLDSDVEVVRGDMICAADSLPDSRVDLTATLCWLDQTPLRAGGDYLLRHTTRTVPARVESILSRLDVNSLNSQAGIPALELNEIGQVAVRTAEPLFADAYDSNRSTGSFILVDAGNNATVAAGLIR